MGSSRAYTVEAAQRQIRSGWQEIRNRLNLGPHNLTPFRMARISETMHRMGVSPLGDVERKDVKYMDQDLAHKFVVEHTIESLRRKISLTKGEEALVRAALGRVEYNPPLREHERQLNALIQLQSLGKRGEKIYQKIAAEFSRTIEPTVINHMSYASKGYRIGDAFMGGRWWRTAGENGMDLRTFIEIRRKFIETQPKEGYYK